MHNKRNTLYYATLEKWYLIVVTNLYKSWFYLKIDGKKNVLKKVMHGK